MRTSPGSRRTTPKPSWQQHPDAIVTFHEASPLNCLFITIWRVKLLIHRLLEKTHPNQLEATSSIPTFCTTLLRDFSSSRFGPLSPSGGVGHDAQSSASFCIWIYLLLGGKLLLLSLVTDLWVPLAPEARSLHVEENPETRDPEQWRDRLCASWCCARRNCGRLESWAPPHAFFTPVVLCDCLRDSRISVTALSWVSLRQGFLSFHLLSLQSSFLRLIPTCRIKPCSFRVSKMRSLRNDGYGRLDLSSPLIFPQESLNKRPCCIHNFKFPVNHSYLVEEDLAWACDEVLSSQLGAVSWPCVAPVVQLWAVELILEHGAFRVAE